MNDVNLADELEQAVAVLIARGELPANSGTEVNELAAVAEVLWLLPDPEFRTQLLTDLGRPRQPRVLARVALPDAVNRRIKEPEVSSDILPSLFGGGFGNYLLNQRSFAASLAMHVIVLGLIISSGVWAARQEEIQPHVITHVIFPADYRIPAGAGEQHGGGSGGSQDKLMASSGSPPRFSVEQLAPPAIVVREQNPTLPVEPTVIGPPDVTFRPDRMGDPFSAGITPSNGPGTGAGIGDKHGRGVGSGDGSGVGLGSKAGIGGDVYQLGGGITAPRPIYEPEPEYSEEARKVKHQGDVLLSVIVGTDGRAHDIHVQRSLGLGLDEKAMAAVTQWRFVPATRNGRPVAVLVSIEVNFRLY
ncbi:MAG TPA: energy transducer TonB [Terriglobales bacterium]|jgi:TonB family protein